MPRICQLAHPATRLGDHLQVIDRTLRSNRASHRAPRHAWLTMQKAVSNGQLHSHQAACVAVTRRTTDVTTPTVRPISRIPTLCRQSENARLDGRFDRTAPSVLPSALALASQPGIDALNDHDTLKLREISAHMVVSIACWCRCRIVGWRVSRTAHSSFVPRRSRTGGAQCTAASSIIGLRRATCFHQIHRVLGQGLARKIYLRRAGSIRASQVLRAAWAGALCRTVAVNARAVAAGGAP